MAQDARAIGNVFLVTLLKGGGLLMTLGLVALQAAAFGTTPVADGFYLARQTLASAAGLAGAWLEKVFVPVFAADLSGGGGVAAERLGRLTLRLGLGGAALTTALIAAAPWIVAGLAPGFGPEQADAAVAVFRILAVGLPLSVLAGLFAALQFSRRKFGLATIGQLMPRILGLAGFAVAGLAIGAAELAWWLVAGMAAMAAATGWAARRGLARRGPGAEPPARPVDRRHMAAVTAIFGAEMALGWTTSALASIGPPGTLALAVMGLRLLNAAPGMTTGAVGTVYYAEYAAGALGDRPAQAGRIAAGLRLTAFFSMPVAALLLAAAEPITRILLERGAFGGADTAAVAGFVRLMVPSLLVNGAFGIFSAVLLADPQMRALRVAVAQGAAAVATRLALGWALVPAMGLTGLAVAILASGAVSTAVIWWELRRVYGRLTLAQDRAALLRMGVAAAAAGVVAWGAARLVPRAAEAPLAVAAFGVAYLGLSLWMGLPEARAMTARLRRRR